MTLSTNFCHLSVRLGFCIRFPSLQQEKLFPASLTYASILDLQHNDTGDKRLHLINVNCSPPPNLETEFLDKSFTRVSSLLLPISRSLPTGRFLKKTKKARLCSGFKNTQTKNIKKVFENSILLRVKETFKNYIFGCLSKKRGFDSVSTFMNSNTMTINVVTIKI
jgi:hypothetical protein